MDYAMTVLGPVAAGELGLALMHEHLLINMECYWGPPQEASRRALAEGPVTIDILGRLRRDPLSVRDNVVLDDLELAVREAAEFRKLGGGTLVDVTLPDIGRDPLALQVASRTTGLHVVAGCGHYLFLAHPPSLETETAEEVAARLVGEIMDGIGDTGVRPGIIGEIGTSDPLHPREEKVLRAAALAARETGLAITIHNDPAAAAGHLILDILERAGADLSRVVMGHLDATIDDSLAYHRSLADRGAVIQYDSAGSESYWPGLATGKSFWLPSDRVRAKAVAQLLEDGYGDRVVLSHDVCKKMDLTRYGGFGYGHILRSFAANLRDYGVGRAELQQLLAANPGRLLATPTAAALAERESPLAAGLA